MAIAERHGLPVAAWIGSASPHETRFVKAVEQRFTAAAPERMIGDRAYDSDPLDERLQQQHGVELIAPHKVNRRKPQTQDGRKLRRYCRRWKIERLFAWLHNFRRLVTRWEYHAANFLGLVQLGCILVFDEEVFMRWPLALQLRKGMAERTISGFDPDGRQSLIYRVAQPRSQRLARREFRRVPAARANASRTRDI